MTLRTGTALLVASALAAGATAQPAAPSADRRVVRPSGTPATRPDSPGVMVGRTLYIAGQLGLPGDGAAPAPMDAQARQAMDGVGAVLKAAGLGYQHLVKCHVYLADMDDYAAMNAAYGSYFTDRVPARTTIQAVALPSGAGVEIACIAYADLAAISVVRPPAGALPAPLGPYSPAVWAGDTLYVSGMGGQSPVDKTVSEFVDGQVTQTVANIETTLNAAGLGLGDVIAVQGYATRLSETRAFTGALTAALRGQAVPAGLLVVPRLPGPIRAELTFVAARPSARRVDGGVVALATGTGRTAYVAADVVDGSTSLDAEARALFARLRRRLQAAGMDLPDVVSVTLAVSDMSVLSRVDDAFREAFPSDPPARTTLQVHAQGKERLRVALVAAK